jgi:putative transposase
MPNHVHVLILPIEVKTNEIYSPSHITYTWKKYTANLINQVLNRNGSLWHHESYDHLIRSDNDFYHTIEYIIDNPVKAGLASNWTEWHGTWIRDDLKPIEVK